MQRLAFTHGKSPATGDDTAGGGGAIYRDGGSLTVIDCAFDDNHAPTTGQDLAGGAIYGFGGGETVVAGSTFTNNSASDGGAIGSLNGDLTIINSTFTDNAATGTGGNPGNGGCGGALYMDGRDEKTSLCGVTITDNTRGRDRRRRSSACRTITPARSRWIASTVDGNRVTPTDDGQRGRALPRGARAHDHGEHDLAQPGLLQRRHLDQHVHRDDDERRRSPRTPRSAATAAACGSVTRRPARWQLHDREQPLDRRSARSPAASSATASRS